MSLTKAKKAVSTYFRGRHAALRLLNGRAIRAGADFFELYLLVRLAKIGNGKLVPHTGTNGQQIFLVAGSPSPSWSKASFIEIKGRGVRTGLQVQCTHDAVELDVVLVEQLLVQSNDMVPAGAVQAAFECKALRGKIKTTHANEMIGKARRVWLALPLAPLTAATSRANRYVGAGINGASANLDQVLLNEGIGLAANLTLIEAAVQDLIAAL